MSQRHIYNRKYIVSGNVLEQYSYEKIRYKGFKSNNKVGKNRNGIFKEKNRAEVLLKARRKIIRTINANSDLDKFITLTFEDNVTDLKFANLEFKKFIKRVNYNVFGSKKSVLKYVAVIEFQDRGAVHYHMICNLPYLDVKKLQDIWGFGFVKLNKIKGNEKKFGSSECDNVGAYVCKYMTKQNDDDRLKERKCYLMSRNLDKSTEIFILDEDKKVDLLEQVYNLKNPVDAYATKSSIFSSMFYNEHTGCVIYHQYNLKRMKNQSKTRKEKNKSFGRQFLTV